MLTSNNRTQTIELAGICFDLIIIRICTGVSTETMAESAGTWRVAEHSAEGRKTTRAVSSDWTCVVELGTPSQATLDAGKATNVDKGDKSEGI